MGMGAGITLLAPRASLVTWLLLLLLLEVGMVASVITILLLFLFLCEVGILVSIIHVFIIRQMEAL